MKFYCPTCKAYTAPDDKVCAGCGQDLRPGGGPADTAGEAQRVPAASSFTLPFGIDAADATMKLKAVFPQLDRDEISTKLTSDKSFVWLKRLLTPQQQFDRTLEASSPGIGFTCIVRNLGGITEIYYHLAPSLNEKLTNLERASQRKSRDVCPSDLIRST